ncbi:unnamed protein product, partial [Rotaria sp. Silwood2]
YFCNQSTMANKEIINDNYAVNFPLQPTHETQNDPDLPPACEHPRVDFSSGWKDRGFAIAFWIHTIIVILVGLILGIPAIIAFVKDNSFDELKKVSSNFDIKPYVYGLGAAAIVGRFASFLTFSIL